MDIPENMQEGDLHLFLVVRLVQDVFRLGRVPNAFLHWTLVLAPNQEWTKYRGIALLEVLHKLCSSMINCRLNKNIGWHEGVHRFRMGKGCTMAIIETKLPSEKARLAGTVLFHDFLDSSKAYNTVDRDRLLILLEDYEVGPMCHLVLVATWDDSLMVPKKGGQFGNTVPINQGV